MPANGTPLGVLVVALLGWASLALEARQVRRKRDLQIGAHGDDTLVLGQPEGLGAGCGCGWGRRQEVVRRVRAAAAPRGSDCVPARVLVPQGVDQRCFLGRVDGLHQLGLALGVGLLEKRVCVEGVPGTIVRMMDTASARGTRTKR